MARLYVIALMLFAGVAAATQCPMAMNGGSVGSCSSGPCPAGRGPTVCEAGSCQCEEGFCRYPASTVHLFTRRCVQRVPGSTCHLTRFCYKAGLTTSFCEKGLCMCKFGYHLEELKPKIGGIVHIRSSGRAGKLVIDDSATDPDLSYKVAFDDGEIPFADWFSVAQVVGPPGKCREESTLGLAGMGNLTAAEAKELAEIQQQEDMKVSLNVLLFSLFTAMAAVAVAGGAVLMRRKLRAPTEGIAEYKLLAA